MSMKANGCLLHPPIHGHWRPLPCGSGHQKRRKPKAANENYSALTKLQSLVVSTKHGGRFVAVAGGVRESVVTLTANSVMSDCFDPTIDVFMQLVSLQQESFVPRPQRMAAGRGERAVGCGHRGKYSSPLCTSSSDQRSFMCTIKNSVNQSANHSWFIRPLRNSPA